MILKKSTLTSTLRISLTFLLAHTYAFGELGHQPLGTDYSQSGANAYAQMKHGIDGSLFLDPYFLPFLENTKGLRLLDAGCGAGPWSILAAQNGALVSGIDIQENMISLAKTAAQSIGIMDHIIFDIGTVSCLPYDNNYFDRTISINVGCNLPPEVFSSHFKEMFRTLKPKGKALITTPASFSVLFTKDEAIEDLSNHIEKEIYQLTETNGEQIRKVLNKFDQVFRATFAMRNEKLTLISDEKMLTEGEAIWRKIPGLAVPNFYHSEEKYIEEIIKAGFTIDRIDRPRFQSYAEWIVNNHGLAEEYCYFHAFTIFHITKPA